MIFFSVRLGYHQDLGEKLINLYMFNIIFLTKDLNHLVQQAERFIPLYYIFSLLLRFYI